MGLFDFLGRRKRGGEPSQRHEPQDRSELQDRWLRDIETCCFSDFERDGLFFFIGLLGELYLKKRDVGDSLIDGYVNQSVGREGESDDQYLDSDQIRSTIYTAAVILQEKWSNSKRPLSDYINVGEGYVFEGILDNRIYDHFHELAFTGKNVDDLFLAILRSFGECLSENGIKGFENCLRQGSNLSSACILDDAHSSIYVFEKLIVVMPPLFEALLNYPILYASDVKAFKANELFSMILNHSLKMKQDEEIKRSIHRWHQYVFYDDKDTINPFWNFSADKHISTLASLALNGSNLKSHLDQRLLSVFLDNPNVFDTDFAGEIISVMQYLGAIAEIVEINYGYNLAEPNWKNHGVYLQIICFFYCEACLYSVFPKAVKD